MEEHPHIHGHHNKKLEEQAEHGDSLSQRIAIFTAILATVGAIVSFMGGHSISSALFEKNQAVLHKAQASDQWAYYQAKAQRENFAILASEIVTDPQRKDFYKKESARYSKEKADIKKSADAYEAAFEEADRKATIALKPYDNYGISITLLQISIALASVTALTRRRWLMYLAAAGALVGSGVGGLAQFL